MFDHINIPVDYNNKSLRDKAQDVAVVRRNRTPECGMQFCRGKVQYFVNRSNELRDNSSLQAPPHSLNPQGIREGTAGERWLITRTCYAVVAPLVSRKLFCGDSRMSRYILLDNVTSDGPPGPFGIVSSESHLNRMRTDNADQQNRRTRKARVATPL